MRLEMTGEGVPLHFSTMMMKGPVGIKGQLTFSQEGLTFKPTRTLDRVLLAAREVQIALEDLRSLTALAMVNPTLAVTSSTGEGIESYSFNFRKPQHVLNELVPLWAGSIPGADPNPSQEGRLEAADLNPGGEELEGCLPLGMCCAGAAIHLPSEQTARRGWLVLGRQELMFCPLGWHAQGLDPLVLALEDVVVSEESPEGLLHIALGEVQQRFLPRGGRLFCDQLRRSLTRLRDRAGQDPEVFAHRYQCMMMKGPVGLKGEFAVSPRRIIFRPTRSGLDRVFFEPDNISIPLADLSSLNAKVVGNPSLTVTAKFARNGKEVSYSFYHRTPKELVDGISPLWLRARWRDLPATPANGLIADEEPVRSALSGWKRELDKIKPGTIQIAGPVVHLSEGVTAGRGWFLLATPRLLFLPHGDSGNSRARLDLPVDRLRPLPRNERREGWLEMTCGDRQLKFLPVGGQRFIDNFWCSDVGGPSGDVPQDGQDSMAEEKLRTHLGEALFIRVIHEKKVVCFNRGGRILRLLEGVALFLSEDPRLDSALGRRVTMEVGKEHGMHRFRSVYRREGISHRASGVPSGRRLQIFDLPRDVVCITNRRYYYRARYSMMIQVRAGRGTWPCQMVDLSLGGCSFFHTGRISQNSRVRIHLAIGTKTTDLQGEIVNASQADPGGKWLHRCAFLELDPGVAINVAKEVSRIEREQIQREAELNAE